MLERPPLTRPVRSWRRRLLFLDAPLSAPHTKRRALGWRRLLLLGASLCAATALGLSVLVRDPLAHFRARRAPIVAVERGEPHFEEGYRIDSLRIVAASGLVVELALKRPLDQDEQETLRRPLIVLLGGHESGREALRLIGATRGTAIAALSYPYRGEHKPKGLRFLGAVPAIRTAILDTPPAIGLALDWLIAEPWCDTTRVELVGVSLGAPFVCIAAALDARVARVWSVHGAGDPYALLEHALKKRIEWAPLRAGVAGLAYALACGPRIAPEKWVDRIAPRPFVMLNASDDERLPRAAILRLYEAAREPKELVWLPGRHVAPKRTEIVRDLIERVLDRVTTER